jgi:hypothetical protein
MLPRPFSNRCMRAHRDEFSMKVGQKSLEIENSFRNLPSVQYVDRVYSPREQAGGPRRVRALKGILEKSE